jgi:hypothetical protein
MSKKRPIVIIDALGRETRFDSLTAAADYLETSESNIYSVASRYRNHQTIRGYKVRYAEDIKL